MLATVFLGPLIVALATAPRDFRIVDANFDGHVDIVAPHDVQLFDAKTRHYSNASPLARSLSALTNPTFDAAHKVITTRETGPSASRIAYVIEATHLRMTSACHFYTGDDARVGTLVRTRFEAGTPRSTYTKLTLGALDLDPCAN